MVHHGDGKVLRRANPTTIQDKLLVGYQGWFTCPGDGKPVGPGHHGWLHWFDYPIPDGGRPNTDLWPDVSEYSPSELFPAPGLKFANGDQAYLFSSRHRKTVQRHFHWMATHGVDGAFLQRFVGQCDVENGHEEIRRIRDEVGDRVREAAELEGRVFAIMYDVAGVAPDRIQRIIEHDWIHLVHHKGILDSPNYLREKGKPVVVLWGVGMNDQHHDPATVRAITQFIRTNTAGGAYIMAGTPAYWRTSTNDADRNPEFKNVWLEEFDAISPWTIGRYNSLEGADRFAEEVIKGDIQLIKQRNDEFESGFGAKRKIDYIPVLFPGSSGFNMSQGNWKWNDAPRRGGNFFWRQVVNVKRMGVRTIYGAMWDEYDEGTAFMPVVQNKRQVPVHDKYQFMALDEDGFDLPPDWYMRICGFVVEGLRGERLIHDSFPQKELQDYWSSRPKYENTAASSTAASSSSASYSEPITSPSKDKEKGESWEEWDSKQKGKEEDEAPPPPYTLEDEQQLAASQPPTRSATLETPALVIAAPVATPNHPTSSSTSSVPSSSSAHSRGPPPPPMATRPTSVSPRPASVALSNKPPGPSSPRPDQQAINALADDFSRQSLGSSPSLHGHGSTPGSQSVSPNPQMHAFPGSNPSSYPSSPHQPQHPMSPPPSVPGVSTPPTTYPNQGASTAPWASPNVPGTQSQHQPGGGYNPGYAPSYNNNQPPSVPPAAPAAPSMPNHSQSYSSYPNTQPGSPTFPGGPVPAAQPYSSYPSAQYPSATSQQPNTYAYGTSQYTPSPPVTQPQYPNSGYSSYPNQNPQPNAYGPAGDSSTGVGGFSFPSAQPAMSTDQFYAQSPYGQQPNTQYNQYGASSAYPPPNPQYPGSGPYSEWPPYQSSYYYR